MVNELTGYHTRSLPFPATNNSLIWAALFRMVRVHQDLTFAARFRAVRRGLGDMP